MKVHHFIEKLPAFRNAVITIGTFDGVHNGHRQIIRLMKEEADAVQGETVIITFNPHPRQVLSPDHRPVPLLSTLEEKITLLEQAGMHHLVIVPFNAAFAEQPASTYIRDFLVRRFHPHTIIIGHDHRFGHDRTGDYRLLEKEATQFNYQLKEIPAYMLKDAGISSTRIREALFNNDIATANECLGYDYFFSGKVVEGNKLGRTIGFPTANLLPLNSEKLVPGNGVYAVTLSISSRPGKSFKGMMNIGTRPTVNGTGRAIEVNIFDFDEMIYGDIITVYLKAHLRNEKKFDGLDALKAQLADDRIHSAKILE